MSDIVKGVLGGAWSLLVGWLLPCALVLAIFGVFILPDLRTTPVFSVLVTATAANQAIVLSLASVVVGLVLSAFQTPLYRILEGYFLWPPKFAAAGRERHKHRRAQLKKKVPAGAGSDLASAIYLEDYLRYPDSDDQIAPTCLETASAGLSTTARTDTV
jgi:hypothetical protein